MRGRAQIPARVVVVLDDPDALLLCTDADCEVEPDGVQRNVMHARTGARHPPPRRLPIDWPRLFCLSLGDGSMESVEAPPPEFETGPPFGRDFLAHLHAGFFDDNPDVERVWKRVRADPDAAAFIQSLDEVRRNLRDIGP